jgi:predicted MPP superfamily phosphohydrolase
MILALLHLSDIHLDIGGNSKILGRAPQIAAALQSAHPLIDQCLIVVSGDVAFSGTQEQYEIASSFFSRLKDEVNKHYAVPAVVCVPGNHDCDFRSESDLRKIVLDSIGPKIDNVEANGRTLQELMTVQRNFFAFDSTLSGIPESKEPWIVRVNKFLVSGSEIRIVRLNTAFLSRRDEKQGSLAFPTQVAAEVLHAHSDPTLVITVFHHPYGWLESSNAHKFKRLIEAGTDIVLTGHEHVEGAFTKELISGERLEYVEGAVLETSGSAESGFNVILCDLQNQTQKIIQLKWNTDQYAAIVDRDWKPFLRNDLLHRRFDNNREFSEYLKEIGMGFTHPRRTKLYLEDLFVYPDLQRISLAKDGFRKEISLLVPSEETAQFIIDEAQLLLLGYDFSGRSALARKVYLDLQARGFVPVLILGKEIKARTVDGFLRAIDDAFSRQYSGSALESYKQLPADKKALIVDDWHHLRLSAPIQKKVVDAAKRIFGKITVFAGDLFRIEELLARKGEAHPFIGFEHCEIKQFSNLLRGRLIEKWLALEREGSSDDPMLAREIDRTEKTVRTLLGNRLLPSSPFIVLTLLLAYETAKDTVAPSGSYGYLYEYIITKAIARVSKDLTIVDLKYVVLSRLAYYLFEREKKRFTRQDMQQVVDEYHREYDIRQNAEQLLAELETANLIAETDGNFEFRYKYAYYYFVARYIRDAMRVDERKADFQKKLQDMADHVYYDEYMNILMFVLYLTKDIKLVDHIVSRANQIYGTSDPCDFDRNVAFVNKLYTETPKLILPPSSYQEARERQRRGLDDDEVAEDRENSDDTGKNVVYDDSLGDLIKLNIAFKTLQLMGQILRNFPGSLEKDTKLALTRSCYLLGLRSLRAILGVAEENLEGFRKYVAEIIRQYKPVQSEEELARTADEAVIWLTRRCAFGVMKRISYSVGLEILAETYKRLLESGEWPRPFRIVDLTVRLDHFSEFPLNDLESLWSESDRNFFCQMLVRDLVVNNLYLVPLDDRTKQSVCELLGIQFKRALAKG